MWVYSNREMVNKMFTKLASLSDKSISVIPYIPSKAIERKKKIDEKLKEIRTIDPKMRTQVRLGEKNLRRLTRRTILGMKKSACP